MSLYKIGAVTYDGLAPAASALTRDMDFDDIEALDMLREATLMEPDSNGAYRVALPACGLLESRRG